ncbi:DUF2306 domain-containing protein [Paenibacillus sp. GSMTC-2017]|uniref:DUF2306 domain-containing protein n=1 Tax=Paenibacillus sp. GSMTC-2017 TaxID=2794350 RepID=UPI002FBE6CCA
MPTFSFFLIIHIVAGSICLLSGAVAIFARKRKGVHTKIGELYHACYLIVFITAIVMSIMRWSQLQYLFYIAIFSYSLALYGYLAKKFRWKEWLRKHITGMLGSYIGVITAVLVVNGEPVSYVTGLPYLSLWFIPTIIGTPLIMYITNKFLRPRKRSK